MDTFASDDHYAKYFVVTVHSHIVNNVTTAWQQQFYYIQLGIALKIKFFHNPCQHAALWLQKVTIQLFTRPIQT